MHGSVRGARDETRVPTATAARVHIAPWRHSDLAARRTGQTAALPLIGFLNSQSLEGRGPSARISPGLKDTGYVEGETVAIEYRWARITLIGCRHWHRVGSPRSP